MVASVIEVANIAQDTEVVAANDVTTNQVGTSSKLVYLTSKSPREKKKDK